MAHVNRFHVRSALTVVLAVIALTSCGSDSDEDTSAATAAVEPAAQPRGDQVISGDEGGQDIPAATDAPVAPDGQSEGGSGDVLVDPAPDRLLIVEVSVGVEVADVSSTVSDVIAIGRRYGGQVYASDVRLSDPESSSGSIVVKLPPENVEAMIADVSALGRQISRVQTTDDVTDRVTDINTRITTAQQSVDRVQRLLVDAKDLGEVVLLEGELTTRQTVLEELLAEQRNLGNRTALATLTFELSTTPADAVPEVPKVEHHDGIGDAFARGGRAFVIAGAAVLIFIGYTAPFLTVALVIGSLAWMVNRRRARRNRSIALPPPPTPAEGPRTNEPDSAGAARS
jgi:Domain of unknown function (DUF4349)